MQVLTGEVPLGGSPGGIPWEDPMGRSPGEIPRDPLGYPLGDPLGDPWGIPWGVLLVDFLGDPLAGCPEAIPSKQWSLWEVIVFSSDLFGVTAIFSTFFNLSIPNKGQLSILKVGR